AAGSAKTLYCENLRNAVADPRVSVLSAVYGCEHYDRTAVCSVLYTGKYYGTAVWNLTCGFSDHTDRKSTRLNSSHVSNSYSIFFFIASQHSLPTRRSSDLLPVLRKHYTARTCATLWLIPVFLFYQPYMVANITIELPYAVFYIPGNIMELLFGIWLAGFLII